jgi:hypothetical protein
MFRLPCGHFHCETCLKQNIHLSMDNPPFRPAHCCQRIDFHIIRQVIWLSPTTKIMDDIAKYRQKLTEFDTKEKLYCWAPRCSAFIPSALYNNGHGRSAKCRRCHSRTCVACKGEFHFGPCDAPRRAVPKRRSPPKPNNEALFRKLSAERQWKSCPQCGVMVEKRDGCNHIS